MNRTIDENGVDNKDQDEIKDTIKEMQNTEYKIQLLENGYKNLHDDSGKRYYELNRLRRAIQGARMNITGRI